MPGPQRRKKYHHGITTEKKKHRTKRRTRDLDQIQEDLVPAKKVKLEAQAVDIDLPGAGQHYCVHCARYFIDDEALVKHKKGKVHKKRLKELETPAYTIKESESAGGIGTYQNPLAKSSFKSMELDD